jgi:hypothetical protein
MNAPAIAMIAAIIAAIAAFCAAFFALRAARICSSMEAFSRRSDPSAGSWNPSPSGKKNYRVSIGKLTSTAETQLAVEAPTGQTDENS